MPLHLSLALLACTVIVRFLSSDSLHCVIVSNFNVF